MCVSSMLVYAQTRTSLSLYSHSTWYNVWAESLQANLNEWDTATKYAEEGTGLYQQETMLKARALWSAASTTVASVLGGRSF